MICIHQMESTHGAAAPAVLSRMLDVLLVKDTLTDALAPPELLFPAFTEADGSPTDGAVHCYPHTEIRSRSRTGLSPKRCRLLLGPHCPVLPRRRRLDGNLHPTARTTNQGRSSQQQQKTLPLAPARSGPQPALLAGAQKALHPLGEKLDPTRFEHWADQGTTRGQPCPHPRYRGHTHPRYESDSQDLSWWPRRRG